MSENDMYAQVRWMKPADEAILRFLAQTRAELTPSNIARNTGYKAAWVGRRCSTLEEKGLLEADRDSGHPYYWANDMTMQFAANELSPEDLESL
jgi:DNA-binding IclR family transcriptional regulator